MRVLLDRLVGLRAAPLRLPDGKDERVRRVMRALRADPADARPAGGWAAFAHVSERTWRAASSPTPACRSPPGASNCA